MARISRGIIIAATFFAEGVLWIGVLFINTSVSKTFSFGNLSHPIVAFLKTYNIITSLQ